MKPYLVELKLKDTEKLDWKKGLSSYLKKSYGSSQWKTFYDEKATSDLDHLRNNANGELAPSSLSEQNLQYYSFLEHLHLRLGSKGSRLKMEFTWYDAEYSSAQKGMKYSQHTLAFEKSCTLFNIAVIYTQIASEKINDDYKTSITNLTKAFSCFEFLSENFLNSPSVDLQSENTRFLANICHAEAQELFLLKLLNNQVSPKQYTLISKLARTTCNLYQKCHDFMKDTETDLVTYGEPKWKTTITCKLHFYKSLSTYYHGLHLEEENNVGEAIAFLDFSVQELISSFPFKTWLSEFIDFDGFKETLEKKQKELIKDNDYIYHENVPATVQIDSIKALDAIKPPPWEKVLEPYMENVADKSDTLYRGIIPLDVYEKESIYSEEKATLLRKEVEETETANLEYSSFIEFTNLPRLLSDLEKQFKSGNISSNTDTQGQLMREQIQAWCKFIQTNGFRNIEEQMNKIIAIRKQILDVLPALPDDQKENVTKLKSSLVAASNSDEKLFACVKPHIAEINLLNDSGKVWRKFDEFNRDTSAQPSLLDIDDTKNDKILDLLKEVKGHAEDLRTLKEERSRNLSELRDRINNDDITKLLIINKGKSDTELKKIFAMELEKFEPLSTRIEATIYKQSSMIDEIKATLDEIFHLSNFKSKSSEEEELSKDRKIFFDSLQDAVKAFSVFASDFPKGVEFYNSLLNMSKDLVERVRIAKNNESSSTSSPAPPLPPLDFKAPEIGIPPLLPQKSTTFQPQHRQGLNLDSRFQNLNVSSGNKVAQGPNVPPRTYEASHYATIPGTTGPPIPPKQSQEELYDMRRRKAVENEERELQENPTSFYNRPSVFDESMYSKYSS
ncbi:bro1p [Saccharomyces arboricola H-6]|uniref:BRO domain-containing protein 1 n=1 Tax=Saccharomyces arboricola (strain H-6 / AS 2.3317 / CBS 10644) TaxID=1160507 RepID=J8Q138_SACAR|nr:bro1p [Saccharomyces arboricola H-6]